MGRLVVAAFLSIDGVMQAPGAPDEDPEGNFPFGGWLVPFADEVMGQVVTAAIAEPDAFLLGRKTYEIFAGHWPKVTDPADPVATALNAKPKYVASRSLSSVDWSNSHLLEGDVVEAVRRLKSKVAGMVMTQGSSELIQTLMEADLVDEYRLWFFPVVLGQGKRLFGGGTTPTRLKLADSVATSTGALVNTYTAEGRPEVGSFTLE